MPRFNQQHKLLTIAEKTERFSRSAILSLALALSVLLPGNWVRAEVLEELTVKSALVFNLAIFTEWPAKAFTNPESAMQLCVIGDSIIQDAFNQLASKKVGPRPLKVINISRTKNINDCHIVFIGNQDRVLLAQVLSEASGKSILTIDDIDGLSTYKGVVNLQEIDGKIRLNINLDLANKGQLKISARLLKLANIVSG
jgi:hypothetical protein